MEEHNIRQVPLVSKENNHIVGMITQKYILDILVNDLEYVQDSMKKLLDSFEFNDVITTDPLTDIRRIAKVMVDFGLLAVPVVDQEDNLKGIVTRSNVLKAVANTPPLQIWG